MLLEDGTFVTDSGAITRRTPGAALTLSRALCRYRLFRAPQGLSSAQTAAAARTYALAHAPFEQSGSLLFRTPLGAGIWYWDQARVSQACDGVAPQTVIPEPLLRGVGDGWRILACMEGFEAQYWEDGALAASSWRRGPFSREQWAAFVLSVEAPLAEPPVDPPAPTDTPLRRGGAWRRGLMAPPLTWAAVEPTLITVAVCALALTMFFSGQAIRQDAAASADKGAVAAINAEMAGDESEQRVRERLALLQAYGAGASPPDVLGASAEAIAVLDGFNLQPQSWRADESGLRISVAGTVQSLPVRDIVTALEANESLCGVEPSFSEDAVEFRAQITQANGSCGAAA